LLYPSELLALHSQWCRIPSVAQTRHQPTLPLPSAAGTAFDI
jgi:hypothetical protein